MDRIFYCGSVSCGNLAPHMCRRKKNTISNPGWVPDQIRKIGPEWAPEMRQNIGNPYQMEDNKNPKGAEAPPPLGGAEGATLLSSIW